MELEEEFKKEKFQNQVFKTDQDGNENYSDEYVEWLEWKIRGYRSYQKKEDLSYNDCEDLANIRNRKMEAIRVIIAVWYNEGVMSMSSNYEDKSSYLKEKLQKITEIVRAI